MNEAWRKWLCEKIEAQPPSPGKCAVVHEVSVD